MNPIAESAGRMLDNDQPFVLATIVSRQGSTPRTAGTRMIIAADGRAVGTIGGGALEYRVMQTAAEVLGIRQPRLLSFEMTPDQLSGMDMVCGGQLDVLLEFVDPAAAAAEVYHRWRDQQRTAAPCLLVTAVQNTRGRVEHIAHGLIENGRLVAGALPLTATTIETLARDHAEAVCLQTVSADDALLLIEPVLAADTMILFGAGHVAQPTARLAAGVGFGVRVVDDRAAFANRERFAEAEDIRVLENFDCIPDGWVYDGNTFAVIVTRGHLHDQTVLAQILRTEAGYIGMIGSRRKRDHIYGELRKEGFTKTDLERVHCPIGIDIGAETPEEIALSIVAEMVRVRAQKRRP